jgi:DnaJ domain
MMGDEAALRVALDLLHVPSRVRALRAKPLPQGVPLLLRIAAGDREAEEAAAKIADRSEDMVREAAAFFIEQILLCPEADSYRVLGASPDAKSSELRRNMALLIKWLHPDMDRPGEQAVFVHRVTMAWDDLKTVERRAAYDNERHSLHAKKPGSRKRGRAGSRPGKQVARPRWGVPVHHARPGLLRRALLFLLGRAEH